MNLKKMKKQQKKKRQKMIDVITFLLMIHFPDLPPGDPPHCGICRDKLAGSCPGKGYFASDCIRCMQDKINSGQVELGFAQ